MSYECAYVSFFSKNSLENVDTDHRLIFNAVVKYSLQMQHRSLKALWFLLLFQNWVKLNLFAKINSVYYCHNVLEQGLLPHIRRLSNDNFLFQQDGAPAHCSRHTVVYLRSHVPEFIEPENWPPNSPDLNPVDYSVWGALQQMVYRHKISH